MLKSLQIGEELTGKVKKLVFQGKGLVHHEGFVIFVPDVIENEVIRFCITKIKKNFAEGKLLEVLEPSPYRIKPLCPHFGTCGGCQLQHIDPSQFPCIKEAWLRESLYPLLPPELPVSMVQAEKVWAFRRKITLHAKKVQGKWQLGFFSRDNVTLLSIKECPIFFQPHEYPLLKELSLWLDKARGDMYELVLIRLPSSFHLLVKGSTYIPHEERGSFIASLKNLSFLSSFVIRLPGWDFDEKSTLFTLHTLGEEFPFSLEAFVQNHGEQSEKLYRNLIDLIQDGSLIFDLYSGISIPGKVLAKKGFRVKACELSKEAVAVAKIEKPKTFEIECGPVEKVVKKWKEKADWWIVNPPRQGLSNEALQLVIVQKPRKLIYVSCNPTTLKRDIQPLLQLGWKVTFIRGYDMFPQSYHFETMIVLENS